MQSIRQQPHCSCGILINFHMEYYHYCKRTRHWTKPLLDVFYKWYPRTTLLHCSDILLKKKKSPGSSFKGHGLFWSRLHIGSSTVLGLRLILHALGTLPFLPSKLQLALKVMITVGGEKVNVCPSTVRRQCLATFAHEYYTRNWEVHPLPHTAEIRCIPPNSSQMLSGTIVVTS